MSFMLTYRKKKINSLFISKYKKFVFKKKKSAKMRNQRPSHRFDQDRSANLGSLSVITSIQ